MKRLELQAKLETEKRATEAKLEMDKTRLAHNQQLALEKLKLQHMQCVNQTRIRLDEIKVRSDIEVATNSQSRGSMKSQSLNWNGKRFDVGIGQFDNFGENLDSFINRFELVAKAYELPDNL